METRSPSDVSRMLDQARRGCADSLGELLDLYRSYLSLIARLQIDQRVQAKFSPSDVVQQTFLQAKRGFVDFAGSTEGELVSWLRKILASQLAMQVRHYGTQQRDVNLERQMHLELNQSSVMLGGMLGQGGNTPSQSAIRREQAVLLADALSQLPPDYREVIVLRHLCGQPFPDVARQMDRSVDSVKGIWRRAIGKLRDLLGEAST